MTYLKLLREAQVASTREEAKRILALAETLQLLDNKYKSQAFSITTK